MPPGLVVQPTPFQPTPKVVGDGTAIQTQLDRINAGISSEVDIEGGVYIINTPLLAPDGVGSSGIAFTVAGKGLYSTVLRAGPGLVGPILRRRTQGGPVPANVTFTDFCMDGSSAVGNTFGIDISGYRQAQLSRLYAVNTTSDGIHGDNAVGDATGASVSHCLVSTCGGDGIHADSGAWNVFHNTVGGCAGWGYWVDGVENEIAYNAFDGNLTGSMRLAGGVSLVHGNWFADIAPFSLYLVSVSNTLIGNTFHDNGTKAAGSHFIRLSADYNVILGNHMHWSDVTAAPQYGVYLDPTTGNIIANNTAATDHFATAGDVAFAFWNTPSNGNSYIGNRYDTATLAMTPNDPTGLFALNYPAIAYNPTALATITLTGSPLT
jgi:hypothetical protein